MLSHIKETPSKSTSEANNHCRCKEDEDTIDNSSFGERSGKSSSPGQQIVQVNNNQSSRDLEQVKQSLFVESNRTVRKASSQQQQQQEEQADQPQPLTQADYQLLLSQDLINLKQLQWLIKAFNKKSTIIDQYAVRIVNKVQEYIAKSGMIFKPRESSNIEFEDFLIGDEIQHELQQPVKQQTSQQSHQQQQLTLEYLTCCKQCLLKSNSPSIAPYRQQYLQSILLVIDDLATFKKLPNDDVKYEFIEVIEQIECKMKGKEQRKYARRIYREMVNQMMKQQMREHRQQQFRVK